jgi:formamidopyrimidine-DNA glycosylase
MPELPEVEAYRRLAEGALGRRIEAVHAPDAWFLKGGLDAPSVTAALLGRAFSAARRRGKLLLLDTEGGPTLGLRFGMTGRLLVDGVAGVDQLLYSSNRGLEAWDRFAVSLAGGGDLRVRDPRRLGGVLLDPPEAALGPDAATVTVAELRAALAGSAAPLKARLLDQSRLAGVGNLLGDEILWRAGLSPLRPAGSVTAAELRRLQRHVVGVVRDLSQRGGSHTGDFLPARAPVGGAPGIRADSRK